MSGIFNSPISLTRTMVSRQGARKVSAHVFPSGHQEFSVRFFRGSEPDHFDEAGPFEDEHDATEAARRGADTVKHYDLPSTPNSFKNHGADQ